MLTEAELVRVANETGFHVEPLGKVEQLLALLDGLRSHPFLKGRVVLKGGTALNLFVFDVPRLSVDIDLNYIGAADRETMLAERPKVEQAIEAVCGRQGVQIKRVPSDHAGGKWRLSYTATTGRPGSLEVVARRKLDQINRVRDLRHLCRAAREPTRASARAASGSAQHPDQPAVQDLLPMGGRPCLRGRDHRLPLRRSWWRGDCRPTVRPRIPARCCGRSSSSHWA